MHKPIDHDGNRIEIGTSVRMMAAPEELLSGLPASDQSAIQAVVGNDLTVKDFDSYGHAELRFKDKDGIIHYIWVRPSALHVVSRRKTRC